MELLNIATGMSLNSLIYQLKQYQAHQDAEDVFYWVGLYPKGLTLQHFEERKLSDLLQREEQLKQQLDACGVEIRRQQRMKPTSLEPWIA